MVQVFTLGEETLRCLGCFEEYPEQCRCGGLILAASGEMDPEGVEWPLTKCDQCGRSEEEIE
jgi:hypothetical protein